MNKRRWSRGEKWMIVLSCGVCLPGLLLGWIYERQNELPPAPTMVEEVPSEKDALPVLMKAVTMLPQLMGTGWDGGCVSSSVDRDSDLRCQNAPEPAAPYTPQYNREFPLRTKATYLNAAQTSLKLWRISLDRPFFFEEPWTSGRETFPHGKQALRRLVKMQARACWQRNDNEGALSWILALHQDICRDGLSFYNGSHHPSGIWGLQATLKPREEVLDELEHLTPFLSASQLRRAALRLELNRSMLPSRAKALEATSTRYQSKMYRACVATDFGVFTNARHPELVKVEESQLFRFRWANKKAIFKRLAQNFEWFVAREKKPFAQRTQILERPLELLAASDEPLAFGTDDFVWPSMKDDARINAREIVLETAMAVRSFSLENGRTPNALRQLVPHYLRKVEADPYDETCALHYSPQPRPYVQLQPTKEIFSLPLPPDALPLKAALPSGAKFDLAQARTIKGYVMVRMRQTLPFSLSSVGEDGRSDGEAVFQKAAVSGFPVGGGYDDILSPAAWFQIPKQSGSG